MIPTWGQQFGLDALINSADLNLSNLSYSAIAYKGAVTPNFTRATTKTVVDSWGRQVTCLAGEVAFPNARRIYNRVPTTSEDLNNAAWLKSSTSISGVAQTDREGGTTGQGIIASASAGGHFVRAPLSASFSAGSTVVVYAFLKAGTLSTVDFYLVGSSGARFAGKKFNLSTGAISASDVAATGYTVLASSATAVGNGFYLCSMTVATVTDTTFYGDIYPGQSTSWTGDGTSILTVFDGYQIEDVTGQSVQMAGEYVSVGALDYRSALNPLYLSMPDATVGAYASSPDSAALDSLVDPVFIAKMMPAGAWGSGGTRYPLAKWNATTNNRSFVLGVSNATATIELAWSADGTTLISVVSTVAVPFAVGEPGHIRADLDTDNGSGGYTVTFYTSTNGNDWTQLGSPVSGVGVTSVFNSNAPVLLGAYYSGSYVAANPPRIYEAKVLSAGVSVLDFNPHRDATTPTGTITSSTTGEVWTLNGASSVVRSAAYHGSCVDGVKCFPTDLSGNPLTGMTTPLIELAATNVLFKSNTLNDAAWSVVGTPSPVQNLVGPDGGTTGWTLTDNAATSEILYQSKTLTAANWTVSAFVKKTTGAQASYPVITVDNGAGRIAAVTIDTSNGVATVWTAYTAFTVTTSSARCNSFNDNWWRVELTFLATAVGWVPAFYAAGTTNATQSTGTVDATAQGTAGFANLQLELGDKATSYVDNTSAVGSATRNADQFYYTGALLGQLKSLAVRGFKRDVGFSDVGVMAALTDGTAANFNEVYLGNATLVRFGGQASSVIYWDIQTNTYTPGSLSNAAWSSATNDIKAAKDGVAQTQDTNATVPTVTRLEYGMSGGAFQLNGYPGIPYGWTRNLSQSELNAVTA